MSSFDDDLASALDDHLDQFGSSGCVYTPPDGGDPVTLTAVLGEVFSDEDEVREGKRIFRYRDVLFSGDPAGAYGGVADPSRRGTFTDSDGEEWAIAEIIIVAAGRVELRLSQSLAASRSRHDLHRDKRQTSNRFRDARRYQT